jgi:hypothetical protein
LLGACSPPWTTSGTGWTPNLVITSVLGTIGAALGSEADDLKRVEAPTALMRELVDECREAPGPAHARPAGPPGPAVLAGGRSW